ncbi:MAG: hypothetical protein R3F19_22690 [Verrucomicrobiales bacterium]
MKGFAVAIVLGVLTGLWLVNKLPVLRGGMHFEAAPTVAEQLASAQSAKIQVSPDREAHMRRQGARLTFETAFRSTLTLEARQALVAETIAALLPDDWPRALEILIEHSRYPVDPELLAEILKAGGEDAFTMAAQSHRVGIGSLGHALRLAELPDKNRLVAEFIANATVNERGLPFFVIESYDSENPDQSALVAAVKALIEKNPQLNFERLVKGVADAKQLNSKEILAALKPLARNAYQESLVSNQERMLRREAYDTAADNPEIAGISEMRRHLSVKKPPRGSVPMASTPPRLGDDSRSKISHQSNPRSAADISFRRPQPTAHRR